MNKKSFFQFGIQNKILFPIVLMLFLSILAISVYSYRQQNHIINDLMANIVTTSLAQIASDIDRSEDSIQALKKALNKNYLRQARAIREIFEKNPDMISTQNIIALAKDIGVDEIHVVDENGILRWGNITGFYGFDFSTTDQTRSLLKGLKDKTFELAQRPTERGADKVFFQYITIARRDTPGLIQIGVQPKELQKLIAKTDLQTIVKNQRVGEKGYAALMDLEGRIIAHPDSQKIGSKITDLEWGQKIVQQKQGKLKYFFNGQEHFSAFQQKTDKIILSTLTTEPYMAPLKQLRNRMIMAAILSMVISVLVIVTIVRKIVISVNHAVNGLKDISEGEGDLTKRLTISSNDEIGELGKWFNVFIEKLQGIITHISKNSGDLNGSSDTLLTIAKEMSDEANNMSEKSQSVATAAEEMSANMTSVAAAAEESSANINMVSAAAEEMTSTINEIAQNTEKTKLTSNDAAIQAKSASSKINDLTKAALKIGKVVETITDISEQTNLLALNATIEAARAGEAGKGFAVVAAEIKVLARQTAEATLDIKEKIEQIQTSTKDSVSEIAQVTNAILNANEMIDTVAAAVEEQSATTKEIAENVNQAALGIQEVTTNVAQSSVVSHEIAKDIADVNHSSNKMSENSHKVTKDSEGLSNLSEELNKTVDQFII